MPVSDETIESLEAFLDGEMSDPEMVAVRKLLDRDPKAAAMLDTLLAERSVRESAFASMERHDSAEDQVVGRLLAGIESELDENERRDEHRALAQSDRRRMLRYISSAAACVIFSFFAGWIGHSHTTIRGLSLPNDSGNTAVASEGSNGIGTLISNTLANVRPAAPQLTPPANGCFVAIRDGNGQVIGTQHFNTQAEANEFIQDFARWQRHQIQIREGESVPDKGQF